MLDQGVPLHDLLVLPGAVGHGLVLEAGAPVAYALGGAVGGRGRGRAALPARYDLAAHVVACHRADASFPSAARNNSMLLYIAFP